jgi:hypothetical protein
MIGTSIYVHSYIEGSHVFRDISVYFHLYGCGYHHNRVDVIPLPASTPEVDDDPVVLYLGYYD